MYNPHTFKLTSSTPNMLTMAPAASYLTCDIADIPAEDLKDLKASIEWEIKQRKSVDDLIGELEHAYNSIDWGSGGWKDEKTRDAVGHLARLDDDAYDIQQEIHFLTDVEEKWKAALKFSVIRADMIGIAEDYAWKLVNGSCGEWCPDTAETVANFWNELTEEGSLLPSESTRKDVCDKLKGILGNYEYDSGLDAILAKVREPSPKRQKTSHEPETIDLVDSP